MTKTALFLSALLVFTGQALAVERSPAPNNARVYFIWPKDGQVIKGGKFWVRLGLRNAGVAPAGVVYRRHHPTPGRRERRIWPARWVGKPSSVGPGARRPVR